jgi:hypothetical protein
MDKDHRRLNSIVDDRETLARIRAELASMTMLNALSNLLTAMPDLPSILYEILDATIKLQGADFGDVQLYDEATGTLKIVSHRGLGQRFLDYFATVDARETSACGLALQSGTRVIIEGVTTDQDFEPHRHIAASTGFRGVQSIPLLDRNSASLAVCCRRTFANPTEANWCCEEAILSSLWSDVIPSRDPPSLRRWRSFDANGAVLPFSQYPGARALRGETVTRFSIFSTRRATDAKPGFASSRLPSAMGPARSRARSRSCKMSMMRSARNSGCARARRDFKPLST